MLFSDLGFLKIPAAVVAKIGPNKRDPDISWEWIFGLVKNTYPENDRSYIAFNNAVK